MYDLFTLVYIPANHQSGIVVIVSKVITNRSAINKDVAHIWSFPSTKLNTINWKSMIRLAQL